MHLYYNMSSLVYKGVLLERRFGSAKFAALLAELLLLSHGMFVGLAWLAAYYVPEYTCVAGLPNTQQTCSLMSLYVCGL
jgi:membrane associated rhomboid family serine protease